MIKTGSLDYTRAFENLIRNQADVNDYDHLEEGSYNRDFYQFPSGFKGDFSDSLARHNLFRRYGQVLTNVSEGVIQTVTSTTEAKLTGENEAYPEDGDAFTKLTFDAYKLATLSKLPISFVNDLHFDLGHYLKTDFAQRFGEAEEKLLIQGSGTNEPEGLLKAAERGVLTAESILASDEVIALFFSLEPRYRQNAVWIMNDHTAYFLRTLKDSSERYLIENDMQTLLGRPIVISNFMPNMGAGTKPILLGDLSYFWLLERTPLSVQILRQKYLPAGQIGFIAQERLDGKLIRPSAVKSLEVKA